MIKTEIFSFTNLFQWQYGSPRTTVKMGQQKLNKIFHYMDMHRRDELKMEQFVSLFHF